MYLNVRTKLGNSMMQVFTELVDVNGSEKGFHSNTSQVEKFLTGTESVKDAAKYVRTVTN